VLLLGLGVAEIAASSPVCSAPLLGLFVLGFLTTWASWSFSPETDLQEGLEETRFLRLCQATPALLQKLWKCRALFLFITSDHDNLLRQLSSLLGRAARGKRRKPFPVQGMRSWIHVHSVPVGGVPEVSLHLYQTRQQGMRIVLLLF